MIGVKSGRLVAPSRAAAVLFLEFQHFRGLQLPCSVNAEQ